MKVTKTHRNLLSKAKEVWLTSVEHEEKQPKESGLVLKLLTFKGVNSLCRTRGWQEIRDERKCWTSYE